MRSGGTGMGAAGPVTRAREGEIALAAAMRQRSINEDTQSKPILGLPVFLPFLL